MDVPVGVGDEPVDYDLLSKRERAEFAALGESFCSAEERSMALEVPWESGGGFLMTGADSRQRIVVTGREPAEGEGDLSFGKEPARPGVAPAEAPVLARAAALPAVTGGEADDSGHPVFSLGGLAAALAAKPVLTPVAEAGASEAKGRVVLHPVISPEVIADPAAAAAGDAVGSAVGERAGAPTVEAREEAPPGGVEASDPVADDEGPMVPDEEAGWGSTGLLVAGGLLILGGLYLVRSVVLLAMRFAGGRGMEVAETGSWDDFRVHGGMVAAAAGGLLLLLLGTGAVAHRRWAPPLIHALGWVLVLFVLSYAGVAAAAAFYLMGSAQDLPALTFLGGRALLLGVLLLVVVPLGLIGVCQREDTAEACAVTQRSRSWTDVRPVPVLMTFLTGLGGVVLAGAMLAARAAFPAFGEFMGGNDGVLAWAVVLVVSAVAVLLTGFQRKLGWWLLMGLFLVLVPAVFLTLRSHDWEGFLGGAEGVGRGALRTAVAGAGALLPVALILLMARKSFDLRPLPPEER
jgi:hypothetical protein